MSRVFRKVPRVVLRNPTERTHIQLQKNVLGANDRRQEIEEQVSVSTTCFFLHNLKGDTFISCHPLEVAS